MLVFKLIIIDKYKEKNLKKKKTKVCFYFLVSKKQKNIHILIKKKKLLFFFFVSSFDYYWYARSISIVKFNFQIINCISFFIEAQNT